MSFKNRPSPPSPYEKKARKVIIKKLKFSFFMLLLLADVILLCFWTYFLSPVKLNVKEIESDPLSSLSEKIGRRKKKGNKGNKKKEKKMKRKEKGK